MNLTHLEAIAVVQKLAFILDRRDPRRAEVSIHPPFTALRSVQTVLEADDIPIALGAQDVFWEPRGAYTGEISPSMLAKLNVSYVIVGHSERRQYFAETDEGVSKKVAAVLGAGMTPIMCVGETLDEREAGGTESKGASSAPGGPGGRGARRGRRVVVAYEPIWAIGTGRTATPDDAQAVCASLRAAMAVGLRGRGGQGGTHPVRRVGAAEQHRGAVLAQPDIDGALVGGASLDPDEFGRNCRYCRVVAGGPALEQL